MSKKNLTKNIHSSLVKKAEADVEMAKANLAVYSDDNLIGICEHQILAETILDEYKKLDDAISLLETLQNHPID